MERRGRQASQLTQASPAEAEQAKREAEEAAADTKGSNLLLLWPLSLIFLFNE